MNRPRLAEPTGTDLLGAVAFGLFVGVALVALVLTITGCSPVVEGDPLTCEAEPVTPIPLPAACTEPARCSDDGARPWRTSCGRRYECPVGGEGPLECMWALDCDCLLELEQCSDAETAAEIHADTPAWCLEQRKAGAS